MLEELIKVEKSTIGGEEVNSVNMRDVYNYLEIKSKFADWVKREIDSLMLDENIDYIWFLKKKKANNATLKECIVSIDVAKMVCMQSRSVKGKQAKEYFIKVEKVAKDILGEDRLKLEIKALENKVEQDYIRGQIEIAKQLQDLGANLDPVALTQGKFVSKLPQGIGEALTDACSDIRVGIQVFSATHLLNENEIKMKPKDFNDALINAGMMEKYFYKNKPYKKFVNDMNYYGYNRDASSVKVNPVAPRFYEDRFINLLQLLRNEGYID